ncbi:retrovirus-related pol polyprotein from transposon RE2 [Citrus sinensis]|uniref:Retrovirus-related pol polyprotein from transposon RE2 n=1 Tax=Citrus sinensis TaxID=2711 RepID=A0ACB8L8K6_CITSI|nr:retrovirus-related pol polyprotein from transposon RE2 [Citrus sinensis]
MASVHLASSSSQAPINQTIINSTNVTFTFNTPIKLDQSNYLIWRYQVLASIRGNRLEKFIDDSTTPPPSHIAHRIEDDLRSVENPKFATWRSQDQVLLGWLLSSMSEGIISLVFNLETSREVWKAIEVQFGSQSKSRLLHLRYMMNSTRKDDLKITYYFIKMKSIADNIAAAGSELSDDDLILHVLSGLARIEQQTHMLANTDVKQNFEANLAYNRGYKRGNMLGGRGFGGFGYNSGYGNNGNSTSNSYKGGYGGSGFNANSGNAYGTNNQFKAYQGDNQRGGGGGNWNQNAGNDGFNNSRPSGNTKPQWNVSKPTCQICLRTGHTANICWKLEEFIASGAYRPPPNINPKSAYLANIEGPVDANWYMDSDAIHHLKNDINNMHVSKAFTVPQITKNLISISKLTKDNDVVIEFTNNLCFVKDKYTILVTNSNLNTFEADTAGNDPHSGHLDTISSPLSHNTSSPPSPSATLSQQTIPSSPTQLNLPIPLLDTTPNTSFSQPTISHSLIQPTHSSQSKPTLSTHKMITRAKAGIFKPKAYLTYHNSLEPSTISEALSDPKWKAAMQTEYDALIKNKTWTLVPMCSSYKPVGCKWVFRTKYNINGSVSKHKARLVAKRFHQTACIDYSETFSPIVKSTTVRLILSLAVVKCWKVRQIDVNNAFLNGDLSEDVYMVQPEGFVSKEGYICKLTKALYGLKQAPKAWYDKLKGCLTAWKFLNSKAETSLFVKHDDKGIIIVLIYVDDIPVTGPDSALLKEFITKLTHGMHLSQTKYIKDLISKASMQNCKRSDTPFSTGFKLEKNVQGPLGQEFEEPALYRSIVGGLQYLILTRPNIAYSVHKLNQYLSNPTLQHWLAARKFSGLTGYSDADWACDVDDRKSIGAYCIYLELNIVQLPAPILWCDNQSAGELARNLILHSKSKHIELDVHYIRDKVLRKELQVRYIPTEEQVADVLTKALSFPKFNYFRSKLNVINRPLSLRGDVKEAHICMITSKAKDHSSSHMQL